ncbi:hypothetical protein [Streptomyces sp. NPDC020607]|uniref:hypothetical protein n=1 Tax=Streptomyces sp. NPDC020607 TaxID=3365082 RepID=UPI0037A8CA6C
MEDSCPVKIFKKLLVVLPAVVGAVSLTAAPASAVSGTPDGYKFSLGYADATRGWVHWNDYDDDDHSVDYDNIWVQDRGGDSYTIKVTAWYKGEEITKSHQSGNGHHSTISFSRNVAKGDDVEWKGCVYKDGIYQACTGINAFTE